MKFPLYLDTHVGLNNVKRIQHNLIDQSADEDYETDAEILRRTVNVCKRDCLHALKKINDHPFSFMENLHNHKV